MAEPAGKLLQVDDLTVAINGVPVVDGVSFSAGRGEIVALVGESGCGKSLTALSVMGLLPPGAEVIGGEARLDGEDVLAMSSKRFNHVRGNKVAMLFQQPKVMLDPTARVGSQVAESLRRHRQVGRREAKARVV
jgi:peptide/nickel transport system ATP-binding protein